MADSTDYMLYDANKKSAAAAYLLLIFFGGLGIHRFYLRRPLTGFLQLILWTFGLAILFVEAQMGIIALSIVGLWLFVDLFLTAHMVRRWNNELALRIGRPSIR